MGIRSCDEAGDESVRVFRFQLTTLGEIVMLVKAAGYPGEPRAGLRSCKPDEPKQCALVTEYGSTIRVAVSSPAG